MKSIKSKKLESLRRGLVLPAFSKKSAETRDAFIAKLKVLVGEDVFLPEESLTPKASSNIWLRPAYVPPTTLPVRSGADDHLQHKSVGKPT